MRRLILSMLLPVSLLTSACGGDDLTPEEQVAQDLQGQWKSADCEPIGNNLFILRDFIFTGSDWALEVGVFVDDQCTTQSISAAVGGAFSVVKASSLAGAFETDFGFDQRDVTILDQGTVDFLNTQPAGSCGEAAWAVGVAQSIQSTGCAVLGFPSQAQCPTELDLVKLDATTLFLGDRSTDLCQARAASVSTAPLELQ